MPNSKIFKNLTGFLFGKLTVIGFSGANGNSVSYWFCRCSCGNITNVAGSSLSRGYSNSCGCMPRGVLPPKTGTKRNPQNLSRTHVSWKSMIGRCFNKNNPSYDNYGGRGIAICDRWLVFENFLQDMGERPDNTSIERIKNNEGYCKDNCRWATRIEQQNNRRNNRNISYGGKTQTISEWERELGFATDTIRTRINICKWTIEKALTTPLRKTNK